MGFEVLHCLQLGETHHFILGIAQGAQKNPWKSQGHLNSTHGSLSLWGPGEGLWVQELEPKIPEGLWWHCSKEEEGKGSTQTLFWSGAASTIQFP